MAITTGLKYINQDTLPHGWCPGCGHGIVLGAIVRAFEELDYDPARVVVVSGIGCWGKADDYMSTNALHTLHGRALTYATGIKAANPDLHVVALMGDGDGATIGGNHLIHAARRNMDVTGILVNNYTYGMTGGQNSAATPVGSFTSTTIYGNPEPAFDICSLVASAGANYVARETVASGTRLKARIKEALSHEGFGFVEAVGPCTTLFGPRNNMRQPVEMIRWLKEKGVSPDRFQAIEGAAEKGYFTVGKLAEKDKPGFVAMYKQVRERAVSRKEQ